MTRSTYPLHGVEMPIVAPTLALLTFLLVALPAGSARASDKFVPDQKVGLKVEAIVAPKSDGKAAATTGAPTGRGEVCFSQSEMRELAAQKTVVGPVTAVRAARSQAGNGKVVRAVLCRKDGAYYYRISVLQRDGKVAQVTLDGRSGKVEAAR